MKSFSERIDDLPVGNVGLDGHFHDGFYTARDAASYIAEKADDLIRKLFDALCDRHADDLVDELKEEYRL